MRTFIINHSLVAINKSIKPTLNEKFRCWRQICDRNSDQLTRSQMQQFLIIGRKYNGDWIKQGSETELMVWKFLEQFYKLHDDFWGDVFVWK